MGRPQSLTKHILERALSGSGNLSSIARELGVSRDTVERSIRRWGLSDAVFLARNALDRRSIAAPKPVKDSITADVAEALEPEQVIAKPLERDILRLTAADFAGSWRGDSGSVRRDDIASRYRRLRGY
jgi:transposase-like protein